jgi:hypothetical protein
LTADTLDLHYDRGNAAPPLSFHGWYTSNKARLVGKLDGGAFQQTAVSFRKI